MDKKCISVVGLGFIGLPLALSFCERGFQVYGVDVDPGKIDLLQRGMAYVTEDDDGVPLDAHLKKHLAAGTFIPTTEMEHTRAKVSAYVVTVGIPVHPSGGQLIYEPLDAAIEALGSVIMRGQLILLRPTLVPGTVEQRLLPRLTAVSGLAAGSDFHVAYAAERVAEGRAMKEFRTLDVVVGGLTPACTQRASELLAELTDGAIHQTDLRTSQLAKVVENVQRDVNLAIVNELAKVAQAHEVDLYHLIEMTNTHPRVQLLMPSVGVGGFCIPNAYLYLRDSVEDKDMMPLFETARAVNAGVPHRLVEAAALRLQDRGRRLTGTRVAVLGLGMKDGSNDTRQSPAVDCALAFAAAGADVRAFDPTVPRATFDFQVETMAECLESAAVVVVGAWQPEFESVPWKDVWPLTDTPVIIDPRHRLDTFLPTPQPSGQLS